MDSKNYKVKRQLPSEREQIGINYLFRLAEHVQSKLLQYSQANRAHASFQYFLFVPVHSLITIAEIILTDIISQNYNEILFRVNQITPTHEKYDKDLLFRFY